MLVSTSLPDEILPTNQGGYPGASGRLLLKIYSLLTSLRQSAVIITGEEFE